MSIFPVKEVEKGFLNLRNASFISLVCKDKIYQGCPNVSEDIQDTCFSQMLFVQRWDGRIGFPGGMVDEGEDLLTSAIRELKEETNFSIVNSEDLDLIASHQVKEDLNVHLYTKEITIEERNELIKNFCKAKDAFSEVDGLIFRQITPTYFDKWLKNVSFAPAVLEEICSLFEYYKEKGCPLNVRLKS